MFLVLHYKDNGFPVTLLFSLTFFKKKDIALSRLSISSITNTSKPRLLSLSWMYDCIFVGSEAIYKSVKMILLSVKNDWFLDLEHGIDWFDYWRKNPNMLKMEMDIKSHILSVDGVVKIDKYEVSLDENTRKCIVEIDYTDIHGEQRNVTNNG